MGKILGKLFQGAVESTVPGGKMYFGAITKGVGFLKKVIQKKKDKAEQRISEQKARLAQLQSLNFENLQNAGVDTPDSPAQKALFGQPASASVLIPSAKMQLNKYLQDRSLATSVKGVAGEGEDITEQLKQKTNGMEWAKKNWMYLVGGAAVLYYLMKKK